eukprot:6949925-Prymnesium_polylepis.2
MPVTDFSSAFGRSWVGLACLLGRRDMDPWTVCRSTFYYKKNSTGRWRASGWGVRRRLGLCMTGHVPLLAPLALSNYLLLLFSSLDLAAVVLKAIVAIFTCVSRAR